MIRALFPPEGWALWGPRAHLGPGAHVSICHLPNVTSHMTTSSLTSQMATSSLTSQMATSGLTSQMAISSLGMETGATWAPWAPGAGLEWPHRPLGRDWNGRASPWAGIGMAAQASIGRVPSGNIYTWAEPHAQQIIDSNGPGTQYGGLPRAPWAARHEKA